MFTESILTNSSVQLTTLAGTVISVGDDSSGKYVEVISSPLMQRARIVKSDILVKKGVVHYVDYPLTTDPGKRRNLLVLLPVVAFFNVVYIAVLINVVATKVHRRKKRRDNYYITLSVHK